MADDTMNKGAQDRARINIHESYEVEYWSKRFGFTPRQLKDSVAKAGVMVKDVEKQLSKRSH